MKQRNIKFEPILWQQIKKYAKLMNISASQFIRDACREKLARQSEVTK